MKSDGKLRIGSYLMFLTVLASLTFFDFVSFVFSFKKFVLNTGSLWLVIFSEYM